MPRHYQRKDLSGQIFGRLTVIELARSGHQRWGWLCRCECGNTKVIKASMLTRGSTRSCGCLQSELTIARSTKHGGAYSRAYRIWAAIKTRCTNPEFPRYCDYGGRGIKMCDRWLESFQNFIDDMGDPPSPKHSVDRFPDVNGNYEPGNCRWATDKMQARNKRNNRILEFRGERHPVMEWSEILGIHHQTILHRLRAGWTVDRALSEPVARYNSRSGKGYGRSDPVRTE